MGRPGGELAGGIAVIDDLRLQSWVEGVGGRTYSAGVPIGRTLRVGLC